MIHSEPLVGFFVYSHRGREVCFEDEFYPCKKLTLLIRDKCGKQHEK